MGSNAARETASWNSRPGEPPICRSARATASTSDRVRAGSALANESRRWNARKAAPVGGLAPTSATAWRASSPNCSPVRFWREAPMASGTGRASSRPSRQVEQPGSSLRRARSPVAPNTTIT